MFSEHAVRGRVTSDAADGAVDSWLANLAEAKGGAAQHESQVRYTLEWSEVYYVPRFDLRIFVAPRLSDGSLGTAHRLDVATLAQSSARGVAPIDRTIGRLLSVSGTSWPRLVVPSPAVLGAALELAMETGRLYGASLNNPPLAFQPLVASLVWRVGADGRQRLHVEGHEDAHLIPSRPLWYIDPSRNQAGQVDVGIEPQVAAELAGAPALNERQAERVRLGWRRAVAVVPPPRTFGALEVVDIEPVVRVQLFGGEFARARLSFLYEGHEVGANDRGTELRIKDGPSERVMPRRLDSERAAQERLARAGLMPVGWPWNVNDANMLESFRFASGDERAWVRFLDLTVPELRAAGWTIAIDSTFPFVVCAADEAWHVDVEAGANDWFELDLGITVAGERVSLLPILLEALRTRSFESAQDRVEPVYAALTNNRFVAIPAERLSRVLDLLADLLDERAIDPDGKLRVAPARAGILGGLDALATAHWVGAEHLRAVARGFDIEAAAEHLVLPATFDGTLREYQRRGVAWLQALRTRGFGGVLADDMGLGKTVQLLAHVAIERAAGRLARPVLIVAPTSVVPNWRAEIARFTPELRVLTLTGADRSERFAAIDTCDIVLTTYALLQRDADVLVERDWSMAVLDEAQFVKNPRSKGAQLARQLRAQQRIALTGTPVENHLDELWSIFAFSLPALLGERSAFTRYFRTPIEKRGDVRRREALTLRTRPFLLRRTKAAVAADLPPKNEIVQHVELEGAQRDLYETIRLAMHRRVREEIDRHGIARSRIVVLDALLKLRQVCCDPRLVKTRAGTPSHAGSAKLEALLDMLPDLIAEGRRVLLFSQFTSMLDLIVPELTARGMPFVELRGATRDRVTPVERFTRGEVPLFLISLKAGGTGLNLAAADTVIHYDPWWNPAVERQATDRAHRIGQTQPVFVYKLVALGTVEERIAAMQARKAELAESLFAPPASEGRASLDLAEIDRLFAP